MPKILPSENPLIHHKDDLLNLICRGHGPLHWTLGDPQQSISLEGVMVEPCDSRHHNQSRCSKLTVEHLSVKDTGKYSCKDGSGHMTSTYVYVKDPEQPFVEPHYKSAYILYTYRHETSLVIPCRTSSPDTNVTLKGKPPFSSEIADGMVWDPKVGFTIPYGPYATFDMISCISVVKGHKVESMYIPIRLTRVLEKVKITPDRVKVLIGDTLTLNCTGETTFNGKINFTWDFPKKKRKST